MALPDPRRIALAKAIYQRSVRSGEDIETAAVALRGRYGQSLQDERAALTQLRRAVATGEAIAAWFQSRPDTPLSAALFGEPMPAPTVGVRVRLIRQKQDGSYDVKDVYLPMRWTDPMRLIEKRAEQMNDEINESGSPGVLVAVDVVGPTRWPAPSQM